MPKVIVYVRAEDARTIETTQDKVIAEWVRDTLATAIEAWKQTHLKGDA